MTIRSLQVAVCLLLCITPATSFAACKSCSESDKLCGPNCLMFVCGKFGVGSTLDEAKALAGYNEKAGTSLSGLQSAVSAKGLQAIGMKIGLDELVSFKGQTITHLWSNHFVVIESVDGEMVKVVDPPGDPEIVKKADLSKYYSGFALLVAKDASLFPKPEPSGPDLRCAAYNWDFGSVDQGAQVAYSMKCRNVGNADLVISKIDTSCGDCLIPLGGAQTIPPGGEAEIKAMVNTANQRRGLAKELFVSSNDPISPVVHLAVTGYVRPAEVVFSPRAISFPAPRRTETRGTEVYVPVHDEDGFQVTSASSNSPYVTADLKPSEFKDRPGYLIAATLKPGAPIGELKTSITVNSTHPKQPKAEIPVTATIRGNIDLDRDSFFLGLAKKGEERKAPVNISTVSKDPLKISKVESSLECVSVDVAPKTEGKDYILTATLKPDAPLGNIRGEITIHTNDPDQAEIKVPVYAYVEDRVASTGS